ncbi:hypothetical protein [Desulfobaculum bizertense]|uniref:Uncharacterized protein n=1 Tax=Desulfobaculum bizertense DSM 18034 TaxID=1121442 RepID=A0A1T4WQB3_9BACT|nr:hypothetical protein [Desulfobaculum bizertense]UIJ39340.1 hypothetical protein LWC08_07160 [Desulfobaculum bizertense]SKA78791.1 hypothetical protein SAMN02745702_02434 [Desulfobaculum bizertense DSM 18034]
MSAAEKIRHIGKPSVVTEPAPEAVEIMEKTKKDMGKVALIVSILSVVLLVVFFFGLNQNLTSLNQQVSVIPGIQNQIATMETDLATLKDLPSQTRRMVVGTMLDEMAQKANFLGGQMEDEAQAAKLQEAMKLIQGVQADMQK